MAFVKIEIHNRNLEARKKRLLKDKRISKEDKKALIEFLRLASLGKINLRKKLCNSRLIKYLDILIVPFSYFKKPLKDITLKDMEKFDKDLTDGKIKGIKTKKAFSHESKADIRRILKIFLRWHLKGNKKFHDLTDWLDTSQKRKTPEYLSEEEVLKLYKACKTAKQRFILTVLFDLGCRAEEFLNIRKEDIIEPDQQSFFYKIALKEEYSKTDGRTIGLYWKNSTEAVREYLEEIKSLGKDKPVISDRYDAIRLFINRLGEKILKRKVYIHLFRHSSATFYASKLNRQQLCYRYGWKFSSRMPDIYISRAGMNEAEVTEKFRGEEMAELRERMDKLEHRIKIMTGEGIETLKGFKSAYKKLKKKK
jgi:integrase